MYGLKGDGTAVIGINVEYVPAFYLFQPGHSSISNFPANTLVGLPAYWLIPGQLLLAEGRYGKRILCGLPGSNSSGTQKEESHDDYG